MLIEGHKKIDKPENVEACEADPYSIDSLLNAPEFYDELRAKGPFVYLSKYSVLATGRHSVVREVISRPDRFVSSRGTGIIDYAMKENWRKPSIILEVDPPYHTKTRRAMMQSMTPDVVKGLRPMFAAEAEKVIDALLDGREFDAVADIAVKYAINVFPRAVGLKDVDTRKIVEYGIMTFNANGPDNELTREWMQRGSDTVPYIMQACARESLAPGGLGAAIYKQVDSGEIDEDEAIGLVRAFMAAGTDATLAAIASTVWSLATNPDQFEKLKAEPSLARGAFDEALRLNAPVHHFYRTCVEETEIAGVKIPADAKVMLSYASANLDPEFFEDPTRYDITRKTLGHFAFGQGLHACAGQMLARAEGEALVSALAQKVGKIELAGEPVWRPNNFVRSLQSLPVRFHAA